MFDFDQYAEVFVPIVAHSIVYVGREGLIKIIRHIRRAGCRIARVHHLWLYRLPSRRREYGLHLAAGPEYPQWRRSRFMPANQPYSKMLG